MRLPGRTETNSWLSYEFPATHWEHIWSTNPIECTFATVGIRTDKTKGYLSRDIVLTLIFRPI